MSECIHGLEADWCSTCKHGPVRLAKRPTIDSKAFPARFDRQCDGCNLPIFGGQPVRKWSDGKYRHDRCTP